MHGLINRSLQCFVRDTYGAETWRKVADCAQLVFEDFEPVLTYDDEITDHVIAAASAILNKPRQHMLEDVGTYLASNPSVEAVRRLLRFSGTTFYEFLIALEDIKDRARLALPDLELPTLELYQEDATTFMLSVRWVQSDIGHVVMGILRTMADDYGALVILEHEGLQDGAEQIRISLLDSEFSEGRDFRLAEFAA